MIGGPLDERRSWGKKFYILTTRFFRCPGWASPSAHTNLPGWLDYAFWMVFCALAFSWYFILFRPLKEQNRNLEARLLILQKELRTKLNEIQRIRNNLERLDAGSAKAWERVARINLGWLKKGEVVDMEAWIENNRRLAALGPRNRLAPSRLPPRTENNPIPAHRMYPIEEFERPP